MKFIYIISFGIFMSCIKKSNGFNSSNVNTSPLFDSAPSIKKVTPAIKEVSGIADSKNFAGFLWAEEDSGNPPQLSLIGHEGQVAQKVYLKGAVNRDWEDMAIVEDTLYIGDIGDNRQRYSSYKFYKLSEPKQGIDTADVASQIEFKYSDGSHDAEAFIVDPVRKDIYIITKRQNPSRVYKLNFPYSYSSINIAFPVATMPFSGVVSAAVSKNGKEIIIKTYTNLYYYSVRNNQILKSLQGSFTRLPYVVEPQGEAVTFARDNSGYFTLSEKGFLADLKLYFYNRK